MALADITGRTAVVTGATGGIGLWTAVGLAKAGAAVIMVARDPKKAGEARAFVAKQAKGAQPTVKIADFGDLKAVDALARDLNDSLPHLDVLVNNAGIFSRRYETTKDGYERTFAINHLAPFLLTNRLLPALERAGTSTYRSRIVTVASAAAKGAKLDFSDLMGKNGYSMMRAYSRSKLANILFTRELARRLAGKSVTANCLHPGVVATNIGSIGGGMGFVWELLKPVLMTPEKGAENSLYVAMAPEIEGVSGEYFVKKKIASVNAVALDEGIAVKLWQESERMIPEFYSTAGTVNG